MDFDKMLRPKIITARKNLVTIQDGAVLKGQKEKITNILMDNGATVPKDFPWEYTVLNGKYRGKLESRIRSLMPLGMSRSEEQIIMDELRWTIPDGMYAYDFLFDKPNWVSGDFGDRNSCYFNGTTTAEARKESMERRGLGSFRLYEYSSNLSRTSQKTMRKNIDKLKGVGRCWIMCDNPYPGCAIIYNAYGPFLIEGMAKILWHILTKEFMPNLEYDIKPIKLVKSRTTSIYLNRDGLGALLFHKDNPRSKRIPDQICIDLSVVDL